MAAEPKVIAPGEGEVVGDSADRRVEILTDDEALNATWSRFGPGRDGADRHVHREHTDFFYVLEGELTVRLGRDEERALGPGGLAVLPPMVIHGFSNAADADVRYLNLHAPGRGFADYMRSIRDGRPITYDQFDPPSEGIVPPTAARLGRPELSIQRPGARVLLLADTDALAISETVAEPGSPWSPPHVHDHLETIYVLEGELPLTFADTEITAGAGTWVELPPGTPHSVSPPDGEPARYLSLHAPASGFGAFVRALLTSDDELRAADNSGFDLEVV